MASKDSAPKPAAKLTLEEIDKRAQGEEPFFKLTLSATSYLCYIETEKFGLNYGPEGNQDSQSVALKVVKLSKESGSDQVGYVISSHKIQDKYLQVTEQSPESNEREVKFTALKEVKPQMFYQSQLFQLQAHPTSSTTFAFYTTVVDSEGQNKVYYLKPKSGSIVAEESSAPDEYYHFSLSAYPILGFTTDGVQRTADQVLLLATSANQNFLVEIAGTSEGLYLLTGGNYLMRYRTVNPSDNSYVMTLTTPTGANPLYWSNIVLPPYFFTTIKTGITYSSQFLSGPPPFGSSVSYNVVGSPTTPTLLAFTTTVTTGSMTTYLYLDTDPTTTSITATSYTGSLPAAAYKFNVYRVTSVTIPASNIITHGGGQ